MDPLPTHPTADLLRHTLDFCNACMGRGDFSGALNSLSRAVNLAPHDSQMLSHRGRLSLFLKDYDRARRDLDEAIHLDACCAMAHSGLARYHLEQGASAPAEAAACRALALDPGDEDATEILSALRNRPGSTRSVRGQVEGAAPERRLPPAEPQLPPSSPSTNPARQQLDQFLAAAIEYFADVEPPELEPPNLRNCRVLPSRHDILPLMPKGGVCAEVGTQTGEFAKAILSTLQPAKLHLYDINFALFDRAYFESAIQQGVVELHEGDSATLLAALPDRHLDFIYVDADHSYEGVARDLEQAERKITEDGWIVCNDYTLYSPLEKIKYGVYRAVNEFCLDRDFELLYLGLHRWSYHDVALRKRRVKGGAPEPTRQPPSARMDLLPPARTRATMRPVNGTHASVSSLIPAANGGNGGTRLASPPTGSAGTQASTKDRSGRVIRDIGPGDEMFAGDHAHYFGVGESAWRCIDLALTASGRPREGMRRILDLPCGHGRVLRFIRAAFPQADLTACDLNQGAVDFCAKTFGAQPVYSAADVNRIPLSGTFDLIWCGSLLTHLRAEDCAAFIKRFNGLMNPGGLLIFTLHGRWVERSLATGRYKYGLPDDRVSALLKEYYRTGFGYSDYSSASGYGISVSSPAFVLSKLVSLPDFRLISYHEKGWDNHQDTVCVQKQPAAELLG